jgi:hypothetical protein
MKEFKAMALGRLSLSWVHVIIIAESVSNVAA